MAARGMARAHGIIYARPRDQPTKQNPPRTAGCLSDGAGEANSIWRSSFSEPRNLASPFLATGRCARRMPLPAGAAAARETALLSFVPIHFAVYRPLKPRLRWAMQCLVGFADHAGRCFPSLRTFAVQAGISKSAAGRDLAELEAEGHLTRTRRPGGVYVYRIARRFLPRWARSRCPNIGTASARRGMPGALKPH